MHDHLLTLVVPLGAAVLAGAVVLLVLAVRTSTRRARNATRSRPEPRSVVHLLAGDGELRDAIARASRFEREVAGALEERAARYEALLGDTPSELRAVRVPAAPATEEPQSRPA